MVNVIEFVKKHDTNKPDFVRLLAAKNIIRDQCIGEGAEALDISDKIAVEQESINYYAENWHRLIMPFLRFKQPHIANAEDIALSTLKPTKDNPVFFHTSFVKPGRQTYVV